MTTTTVGYGDVPMTTPAMKVFASVHIILSVSWLAGLLNVVGRLKEQRDLERHAAKMITSQLDDGLIGKLDVDGGNTVDQMEFVVGMLSLMGAQLCGEPLDYKLHAAPLIRRFEALDADHSGSLDTHDLEFMLAQTKKAQAKLLLQLEKHRQSRTHGWPACVDRVRRLFRGS